MTDDELETQKDKYFNAAFAFNVIGRYERWYFCAWRHLEYLGDFVPPPYVKF